VLFRSCFGAMAPCRCSLYIADVSDINFAYVSRMSVMQRIHDMCIKQMDIKNCGNVREKNTDK